MSYHEKSCGFQGDILSNLNNFVVPRVRNLAKKMLKNSNAAPLSPPPPIPVQTLIRALLDSILNRIVTFGVHFTMNYGELTVSRSSS